MGKVGALVKYGEQCSSWWQCLLQPWQAFILSHRPPCTVRLQQDRGRAQVFESAFPQRLPTSAPRISVHPRPTVCLGLPTTSPSWMTSRKGTRQSYGCSRNNSTHTAMPILGRFTHSDLQTEYRYSYVHPRALAPCMLNDWITAFTISCVPILEIWRSFSRSSDIVRSREIVHVF